METGYKIHEIMSREVFTINSDSLIVDAAKKMASNKVGSLVVLHEGKIEGILTEQDLARKAVAEQLNISAVMVREIMTSPVHTIEPERDLNDAMSLMGTNEIKHLPVVSKGKLHGIITAKDAIQIEPGLIELLSFKSSGNEGRNENIFTEEEMLED
jgi:signal-transduction protein with cAMP-binding, CBS, and nucleotidyltransferase domain